MCGSATRHRLLRLSAPHQGRVGRADLRPRAMAGIRGRLPVRLAALGRPPALPHRLLRGAEQERQEHPLGRDRPVPAGRRRRAGRRDLLRRHQPRSGAHRVRRGQAYGWLVACAQTPGRHSDQQPARRHDRLPLHAAILGQQHNGRPQRPRRDHRRAARPQHAPRGRRAGDRDRRPPPAAPVRDHHRRL